MDKKARTKRALKTWRQKYSLDACKQSLKGSVVVGLFTLINGFLLGPMGLAFGGISGGAVAYGITKNKLKSVSHCIYDEFKPYCYPTYQGKVY